MALVYKHGTYGEFAESIGEAATQAGTVAVYVGLAPVNLVRGYESYVNSPVKLTDFNAAKRYMGYSDKWSTFDLCEAFKLHFDNASGNIGPIVAVNILDPAKHKKAQETTQQITFTNGRSTIESDTIILDTLVLADKVEGVDFSIDYDFTKGQVIIDSVGAEKLSGSIQATFSEVDTATITEADIVGGVTAGGEYTGLGCVGLVYPELGLIPNFKTMLYGICSISKQDYHMCLLIKMGGFSGKQIASLMGRTDSAISKAKKKLHDLFIGQTGEATIEDFINSL